MKLFNTVLFMCSLLIVVFLVTKNPLPVSKPKDFNFSFNYGIGSKNQLDTYSGKFTQDMISEPSITADLRLSEDDMNVIYENMRKIRIFDYPENFRPQSFSLRTPYETYSIRITAEGKEKYLHWSDGNDSHTKESLVLRVLFRKIQEIIYDQEEVKKLPRPKGGYM